MREKRNNCEFQEEIKERRGSKYDVEACKNEPKHEEQDFVRYDIPHEFKLGEKVTCLKTSMSERPVPHKVNIEYRGKDFALSLPPEVNSSEILTLPSEDELSNGSGNVSPRLRRAKHHTG